MLKKIVPALLSGLVCVGSAHAALTSPGDLMFTTFNADEDGFTMAAFVDIVPNTTVYFSDNEWNGSAIGAGGAFNTGESYSIWQSGGGIITAGTVIRFSATDNSANLAASIGTLSRATVTGNTNWGFSQDNDTVYAYLGSNVTTPTVFLGAVSTGGFSVAQGTLANTGLAVDVTATQLSNGSDFGEYAGARSGQQTFAAYRGLVANAANWTDGGNGSYAAVIPNTTAFTITPVPEPETYALLLAGLGIVVGAARKSAASRRSA